MKNIEMKGGTANPLIQQLLTHGSMQKPINLFSLNSAELLALLLDRETFPDSVDLPFVEPE